MGPLMWDFWHRSAGCIHWMDKTSFAGKSFSSIFWSAMRLVFLDEHMKPGLLYQGALYPLAEEIISLNGHRWGFSQQDEIAMLKLGNFKYGGHAWAGPRLSIEGPDQDEIGQQWGWGSLGAHYIRLGFYDIVKTALTGYGLISPPPPSPPFFFLRMRSAFE
jgi:hypothetical protein